MFRAIKEELSFRLCNFRVAHRVLFPFLIAVLALVLVGGTVLAVSYVLNKTVPATVTITEPTSPPTPPTPVTLYIDALGTNPVPVGYVHSFGTVVAGGTPQNSLWFRADEIGPGTIDVTDDLEGYNVGFAVGTPTGSMPGRPTALALFLPTNMAVGSYSFNLTVTGSGP